MRVAIIGTGSVGRALALGLRGKGHKIVFGSRDPQREFDMAESLAAATATPAIAAKGAQIVILALPWRVAQDAVRELGDLSGKIVIDCMNPLGMVDGALGLVLGHDTSGAEQVAGWLPGARVVKTLNQVGAEVMADTSTLPHPPVMFMAGDDAAAKGQVASLLSDLGFDAQDAGDLRKARLLEPFAMVWINQALARGKGRHWALAALHSTGEPQ